MRNRTSMSGQQKELRESIVALLQSKASVKQDIADYSEQVFELFREIAGNELVNLQKRVKDVRVRLRIESQSANEFVLYVGSDVLVFQLHSNVFQLPEEHPLWKEDYLKDHPENGYFGVIHVYNFLAESYEKHRLNDVGYLIARVFVNREHKCLVEAKGQLGTLYEDVAQCELTPEAVRTILQCSMVYAINFDLVTPPYNMIEEASVMQIQHISSELQMATGKRLGFKFSSEDKTIF